MNPEPVLTHIPVCHHPESHCACPRSHLLAEAERIGELAKSARGRAEQLQTAITAAHRQTRWLESELRRDEEMARNRLVHITRLEDIIRQLSEGNQLDESAAALVRELRDRHTRR